MVEGGECDFDSQGKRGYRTNLGESSIQNQKLVSEETDKAQNRQGQKRGRISKRKKGGSLCNAPKEKK